MSQLIINRLKGIADEIESIAFMARFNPDARATLETAQDLIQGARDALRDNTVCTYSRLRVVRNDTTAPD